VHDDSLLCLDNRFLSASALLSAAIYPDFNLREADNIVNDNKFPFQNNFRKCESAFGPTLDTSKNQLGARHMPGFAFELK
jgi:hypothetical protein